MRGSDFLEQVISGLGLSIAIGRDQFTMSHGSFCYKRKQSHETQLTRQKEDTFSFRDSSGRYCYRLHKEWLTGEKNGICHLYFTAETGDGTTEERTAENRRKNESGFPDGYGIRFLLTLPADPKERIYGCGETYARWNLKGEKVRIFVAEHQNARRIGKKLIREKILGRDPNHVMPFSAYESYYAQPTFVSSQGYFVHVNCKRYAEFDFREGKTTRLLLEELPDFYLAEAEGTDCFPFLSMKLSALLGRQKSLPEWINRGVILAVQEGVQKIDEKIRRARAHGVTIAGIWSQDWCGCRRTGFGYQVMWNWKADDGPDGQYPDLKEHIQKWEEEGIAFLGYINPFIALEKDLYKETSKRGYCVKDKDGKDYLVKITTFPAAMVDFTNPDAYAWYKNLIKENMIGIGMKGWMADFGEYLPLDCVLYDGSDPMDRHNEWPTIWARMNQEAISETGNIGRVFFFTRAGSTDSIRNSMMMWTGDQHVDWSVDDGLPSVIPATLSLAMSGFGMTHSDAGGYTTLMQMRRTKELLIRWEEMNAFSPLLRTHEGNQPANDVQFDDDEELLSVLAKTSRWHLLLSSYLDHCMEETERYGWPLMRPLFYHYDEDFCYDEKTEYLLGRDLLVAPILTEGQEEREVRLPKDHWIDLWTGEEYEGGTCHIRAPLLERIPVFVRDSKEGDRIRKLFLNENRDL